MGRGRGLTVLVVSLPGILTPYGLAAFPAALTAEAGDGGDSGVTRCIVESGGCYLRLSLGFIDPIRTGGYELPFSAYLKVNCVSLYEKFVRPTPYGLRSALLVARLGDWLVPSPGAPPLAGNGLPAPSWRDLAPWYPPRPGLPPMY